MLFVIVLAHPFFKFISCEYYLWWKKELVTMYELNKCLAAKACWKHWNGNSAMYNISILSKINSFTDGWDEQFVSLQLLQQWTAWSNTYILSNIRDAFTSYSTSKSTIYSAKPLFYLTNLYSCARVFVYVWFGWD